jgi:hypothetical protein
LAAAFRGERRPRWSRALRPDAKEPFDLGERYLATGDSLFLRSTYKRSAAPANPHELFGRLAEGTATFCYDALRQFEERLTEGALRFSPTEAETVANFIRDDDADVASTAIGVLSACGGVSDGIVNELQRAVWSPRTPVRAAAIRALGRLGVGDMEMIDSLGRLLNDDDTEIVGAVAAAATFLGPRAAPLADRLVRLLEQANIHAHGELSLTAARALAAVVADPIAAVKAHYDDGDPELRIMALEAVRTALGVSEGNTAGDSD